MTASQYVLQSEGLSKRYQQGPSSIVVLSGVDLAICRGERVAIIGSSGAGKTTLLHMLGGLDLPSDGRVWVSGEQISSMSEARRGLLRNRHLGFVYQLHHLLGEFSAIENVAMPLLIGGMSRKIAKQKAAELLQQVGLGERLQHKPAQLSGGERQRVAIARALVTRPDCVLMDEPTGNLDRQTAADVENLLIQLNRDLGISFVVVTHDRALASRMDRTLELKDGRLYAIADEDLL